MPKQTILQALIAAALAICIGLSLAACSRDDEPVHQEQILVFGTLVDITLWGVDDDKAQQATAAVIHTLNELHHRWHAWEPGPLTDINTRLARVQPRHRQANRLVGYPQ